MAWIKLKGALASSSRHHTYPRSAPPKRAPISCRMEPLLGDLPAPASPPHYPDSPCDKKPRPNAHLSPVSPSEEVVQFRERGGGGGAKADRLSASDFYTVSEDVTPQPFKGTYDEELLLGSRVLVFSLSAEAPCFSAMVLAAHYMGLRPHATVLIVQTMDPAAAHNYSEAAVKDYNRGRHYLVDLARRSSVPVFDNVDDAMLCVVRRLRTEL
uniref:Uncharacterized protein n=1 Tax=Papilio xuthus TaxID=66420 RepID=I4DPU0_PAPXU|nr:unknown unsecreted protein [Papilio xuthus]